jgi:hypothetical protein
LLSWYFYFLLSTREFADPEVKCTSYFYRFIS